MNSETPFKKPLREKLMNLCGMYWWPPTHNDPRIKGPQPRLVTREQYERLVVPGCDFFKHMSVQKVTMDVTRKNRTQRSFFV